MIAGVVLLAALAQPMAASQTDPELVRFLTSFDEAWGAGEIDRLGRAFAETIWNPTYGRLTPSVMEDVFSEIRRRLDGASCRTRVLGTRRLDGRTQAFLCRTFVSSGRVIEEECHVVYVVRRDGRYVIDGFEDYCHEGLAGLSDGLWRPPGLPLAVPLPSDLFFVPHPPCGRVLVNAHLRTPDLRSALGLLVLHSGEPVDLHRALRLDLSCVAEDRELEVIEPDRCTRTLGRPAVECAYRLRDGSETRLGGRVYVALDETYLLALTWSAPEENADAHRRLFEKWVAGVSLDLAPGERFAEAVDRMRGWGEIRGRTFHCPETGLRLDAPEGVRLRLDHTGGCTSLVAASEDGSVRVQIDCVRLEEDCRDLEEYAAEDEAIGSLERLRARRAEMGGHRVLEVLRRRGDRFERVLYLCEAGRLVTLTVVGSSEEQLEEAGPVLTKLLERLRFAANGEKGG